MATVKEMAMMDAAASIETAAMMSAGDTFEGTLSNKFDEDWIAIEMTAGMLYTINLSGRNVDLDPEVDSGTDGDLINDNDGVADTFLKLFDSKGGLIKQNDDIKGEEGNLNSEFQFIPEVSGTYYISAGAYLGNVGADNGGAYEVTVTEMVAGLPDPIDGTDGDDKLRGTENGERITGGDGDDSLFGFGGDDTLSGGMGNDLLVGGMGGDSLSGGEGVDTISYNVSPAGVTINLTDGTARGGDADGDTLVDRGDDRIENVVGSGHDDVLTGNRQANTLQGLAGADELNGDEGDDMLSGGLGDDVLDGGDEDDTLEGGPGADTLIGGQGADTASYAGSTMGVMVRLHSNKLGGGDAKGDVFSDTTTNTYLVKPDPDENDTEEVTETVPDIVNLIGSGMADTLAGDSRANKIEGGGGDDMIFGGPGGSWNDSDNDDTLMGGYGNDKIYGGKGNDTLNGGPGDDLLVGGTGADTFMGGYGSDMIYADRADIIGVTTIDGGDEMANAPPATDILSFAKFTDEMLEDGTGITLNLEGNLTVTKIEHLIGTSGVDMLTGRNEDTDDGRPAPEIIEGGDGGDTLIGGEGPGDTVSYASSDDDVRVDLGAGTDTNPRGGHASGDTISGFENVMGSAYGDDLTARDGVAGQTGSTLWGLGGDDELEGGLGNDTLEGGAGADELDGGTQVRTVDTVANTQVNTLSYAGSDAGVRVNLAAASASGGHADGDEIATYDYTIGTDDDEMDFEVATFVNVTGSAHDDHLTGDMFNNHLSGGGGDDSLRGAAGADVLAGGPGADVLDGGEDTGERNNMVSAPDPDNADDTVMVAASEDWAAYRGAMAGADGSGVTVNIHTGYGTAGDAMGDELKNIELYWGSMNGDDTFIASAGADIIHGDGGSDTVSYEASRHGVTVVLPTSDDTDGDTRQFTPGDPDADPVTMDMFNAAADPEVMAWRMMADANVAVRNDLVVQEEDFRTTTKSYAEGDVLASIENVTGSRDGDVITGDGVPNVLKGGGGDDELVGGGEDDTLHGGEGDDLLGQTTGTPLRAAEDLDGDGDTDGPGEGQVAAVAAITDDIGNDTMNGGPGDDMLYGGAGADTLNGGVGDDDLTGGTGDDTFVFTQDGLGSDVILDFAAGVVGSDKANNGTGDKIDLSAFNIDDSDLLGLLDDRAGNVIVNLEEHGGGRITIRDVTVGELTGMTDSRGLIHNDVNGDDLGVGKVGMDDGGSDGVFIL